MCALCAGQQIDLVQSSLKQTLRATLGRRPKKIWEIEIGYHCSIIGTCLTSSETKKLIAKTDIQLSVPTSDYEAHAALVNLVTDSGPHAKIVHRTLANKFKAVVKRFARVKTDEELGRLWDTAKVDGKIAGPYWAIMTNPRVSNELTKKVYGDIHMLSHQAARDIRYEQRQVSNFKEKYSVMREALAVTRKERLETEKNLLLEIASLKMVLTDLEVVARENELFRGQLRTQTTSHGVVQAEEWQNLKEDITQKTKQNNTLSAQLRQLEKQVREDEELLVLADTTINNLQKQCAEIVQEHKGRKEEIISLETALLAYQGMSMASSCSNCDDQNSSKCPGPDFCGKTILYVGGHHKMIPHYKKLIEQSGGTFMHHDGGKETSRRQLPGMLNKADLVLCPIDCVSHDACLCVKKMCKRYQKPFVLMRNSGIATLAKGLNDLSQQTV